MTELFPKDIWEDARRSSKGNQLKAARDGFWYKADYTGYEGLSEYIVSALLAQSSLRNEEYVRYETEELRYGRAVYRGCKSQDFLPAGWQLITAERLFRNAYGKSLYESVFHIRGVEERLRFLVGQMERLTGRNDFGAYLSKMLTIDALFLNEDRHTHNIAVLYDTRGQYRLCPFFDHGAGLLSDTTQDYPMGEDIYLLIGSVRAKTCAADFDEQMEAAEVLFGRQITFSFDHARIQTLLDAEPCYPTEIKTRVRDILFEQMRKYPALFSQ